jgi:hypothetical protein
MDPQPLAPYDGNGYGRSLYWQYYARQTAFANKEYCLCWENNDPDITIVPSYKNLHLDPKCHRINISIKCQNKVAGCPESFEKTQEELEIMFNNFYKS